LLPLNDVHTHTHQLELEEGNAAAKLMWHALKHCALSVVMCLYVCCMCLYVCVMCVCVCVIHTVFPPPLNSTVFVSRLYALSVVCVCVSVWYTQFRV
jgi:hypothetical protein